MTTYITNTKKHFQFDLLRWVVFVNNSMKSILWVAFVMFYSSIWVLALKRELFVLYSIYSIVLLNFSLSLIGIYGYGATTNTFKYCTEYANEIKKM